MSGAYRFTSRIIRAMNALKVERKFGEGIGGRTHQNAHQAYGKDHG